jgi:hypothetical protein
MNEPSAGRDNEPSIERWISIEKSWAALDYLAEKAGVPGMALALAGDPIAEFDEGYLYYLSPEKVERQLHVLQELSFERLISFYNAEDMIEGDIYPGIWSADPGDFIFPWIEEDYNKLHIFLAAATSRGEGITSFLV